MFIVEAMDSRTGATWRVEVSHQTWAELAENLRRQNASARSVELAPDGSSVIVTHHDGHWTHFAPVLTKPEDG